VSSAGNAAGVSRTPPQLAGSAAPRSSSVRLARTRKARRAPTASTASPS